jgi:hypothetical protein
MILGAALATAFVLLFEYPRAYQPAPSHFLIPATHAGLTDTLRVVPSPPGACAPWADGDPDTVCAAWPGCPAEGVMTLHVHAVWGDTLSAVTDDVPCQFRASQPCECLPVDVSTAAPITAPILAVAPPPSSPVLPPGGDRALQRPRPSLPEASRSGLCRRSRRRCDAEHEASGMLHAPP